MTGPTFALELAVNGRAVRRAVEPRTLLVDFLRDVLGLTGTHVGCDTTQCGCCAVHVDGRAVKSCTLLAVQAAGTSVTTIEGLAAGDGLHPMQQAFIDHHALQCGFCTPGMIMTAVALARENREVTPEIARDGLAGNLCRCTGYLHIVDAIVTGAAAMRADAKAA